MSTRDGDHYEDSQDMIERIRRLREAAEQKMNAFGDVSEYDITIIQGQLREEPITPSQSALDFHSDAPTDVPEEV